MPLHLFKSVVFTVAILVPPRVIYRLWKYRRPGTINRFEFINELPGILFCIYIAIVIALTILPAPFSGFSNTSGKINPLPFVNTYQQLMDSISHPDPARKMFSFQNIFGNLLLFVPLGLFLPFTFPGTRSLKKIALIAFAGSVCIETIQLLLRYIHTYRTVDIDDVILNTAGALLGYGIYVSWMRRKVIKPR